MSRKKRTKGNSAGANDLRDACDYPVPALHPFRDDYVLSGAYYVSVTVLSDHAATVARVTYDSVDGSSASVSATGSSKREPGDDYDPETGRLLATARALEKLAGRLNRKAAGRVRNAAAIKGHHEEIRRRQAGGYPRPPRPGEVSLSFRVAGPITRVVPGQEGEQ